MHSAKIISQITMKQLLILLSTVALFSLSNTHQVAAQNKTYATNGNFYCNVGLQYQFTSATPSKLRQPIILTVMPNSPAVEAGLKVGDIIETVNGKSTSNMSEAGLNAILTDEGSQNADVTLEVSNFGYSKALRTLRPTCTPRNLINEEKLADAFAFYSLEDAASRIIVYPFTTRGDAPQTYLNKLRFSFTNSSAVANSDDDKAIVAAITQDLESKGLKLNPETSDMVIDYYYTVAKNPYFNQEVADKTPMKESLRYNPDTKQLSMEPILHYGADKRAAQFIMTFGVRIFDAHNTDSVLWNCESVEFLSSKMSIADYAKLTVPVMMMQFPFVRYNNDNFQLLVVQKKFNYTGILYDINDISRIGKIEKGSPAEAAGLKAGDHITAINGKFITNIDEINEAYKNFVRATITYRDEKTLFTDSNGLKHCRYWDETKYPKIIKAFNKEKYHTVFAYLFQFRPYINGGNTSDVITFNVVRDGVMKSFQVTPFIYNYSYVTPL